MGLIRSHYRLYANVNKETYLVGSTLVLYLIVLPFVMIVGGFIGYMININTYNQTGYGWFAISLIGSAFIATIMISNHILYVKFYSTPKNKVEIKSLMHKWNLTHQNIDFIYMTQPIEYTGTMFNQTPDVYGNEFTIIFKNGHSKQYFMLSGFLRKKIIDFLNVQIKYRPLPSSYQGGDRVKYAMKYEN